MGAATNVGRVGGLAVALGVGSAVFTGQGVAWADEADSSPSKSSTSAPSDGDKTDSTDKTEKNETSDDAGADKASGDTENEADPEAETETEKPDEPAAATTSTPRKKKTPSNGTAKKSATEKSTPKTTRTTTTKTSTTTDTSADPATLPQVPKKVAVFATAGTLAASSPAAVSPKVTAPRSTASTPRPKLITAVVNIVNSTRDWAHQKADAIPDDPAQPPFLLALLSFARRELENLSVSRATTIAARTTVAAPTSLALTEEEPAAAAALVSSSPWLNPQVSPSTNFVSWVTGNKVYGDKTLANTLARFGVHGTDVGVMWDNGMVDDPSTPLINEHQVLIAVGDTFGAKDMTGRWIYNTLFRSSDDDLSDGMTIPKGEWFNGNMFGGAPLSSPTTARPIINRPSWLPNSVTLIPTAGVSLPTEVTEDTPFGTIQYVSFMSVSKWGSPGRWTTNYSAIAYSTDNGENFTIAPQSVRYNSMLSSNKNFQQSAFLKGDDGYVYMYGTPNGRQGAAYLARVDPDDILTVSKYEYYKKGSSGWLGSTPARWVPGSPSSASAIIGKSGGSSGVTKPGYTVSEMSVQYNEYLQKYVVLYGDQSNNIVMRTADTPEGSWSDATVLMGQQPGGIYAPMMHPWSPSTVGTGSDLYWNLSLWSEYNVMLMHTDLTKL